MRKREMSIAGSEIKLPPNATEARTEFARRLRELRVPKGFRTARSLARALGIDENRYTRYERAEVEPDLEMIRRICLALGVSPNELLGGGPAVQAAHGRSKSTPGGPYREPVGLSNRASTSANRELELQTAAWRLAEVATAYTAAADCESGMDADSTPLARVKRTGQLYRKLMSQPFESIADISIFPESPKSETGNAAELRDCIDRLVQLLAPSRG